MRTCLDRLEAEGIIGPCDPDMVAARIKRADRRPQGWALNLSLVRADLAKEELHAQNRQFLGPAARLATAPWPSADNLTSGVQPPHPDAEPVDSVACEVQPLHPASETGCNQRADGVQPARPRGAAVAPEPHIEPSREPSAAHPHVRGPAAAADADGGQAGDYFAALGTGWQLTASQRARLAPAVTAALSTGWTPAALAAFTGSNTSGVRNPYAVLAARLSPAELPEPPARRPPRPPWCGTCDKPTRRRQDAHGADAGRCPSCHPLAVDTALARPGTDCGDRSPTRQARPAGDGSSARGAAAENGLRRQ